MNKLTVYFSLTILLVSINGFSQTKTSKESDKNKWDLRFYPFSEKDFFAKTFQGAEMEFTTDEKGEPSIKLIQHRKVIATGKRSICLSNENNGCFHYSNKFY